MIDQFEGVDTARDLNAHNGSFKRSGDVAEEDIITQTGYFQFFHSRQLSYV